MMSIWKKLLEVEKHVRGLGKDSSSGSGGFGYKYVSGSKVLEAIKPLMVANGLLLKQEIVRVEVQRVDYKTSKGIEKSEHLFNVWQKFTWVDVDTGEMDVNEFFASGMNDWEKGLGSALTYAERYFLLKYFHIPTDEDDIDNSSRKMESEKQEREKHTAELKNKGVAKLKSLITLEQEEELLKKYHVKSLEELSLEQLKESVNQIEMMKK